MRITIYFAPLRTMGPNLNPHGSTSGLRVISNQRLEREDTGIQPLLVLKKHSEYKRKQTQEYAIDSTSV